MVGNEGFWIYAASSLFQMLVYIVYFKEMFGFKRPVYSLPVVWVVYEVIYHFFIFDVATIFVNILAGYLVMFFMTLYYCNGTWKKKMVLDALFVMLAMVCEPALTIVIVELGISTAPAIYGNYKIVYAIYFLEWTIILVIIQTISIFFKGRLHRALGSKHGMGVLVISGCSMVAYSILTMSMIKNVDFRWENMLAFAMFLAIIFMSYYFFLQGEDKSRLEMEYKIYEEQVKIYEQWTAQQKQTQNKLEAFRHDMKNHILALKGICNAGIEDEKWEKLKEVDKYLNTIGTNYSIQKNEVNSGSAFLDSILNMKTNYAVSNGIEVENRITIPKEFAYDNLDMTVILGNLLDNAIEACKQLPEDFKKRMQVEISYDKGNLLIFTENTYNGVYDGMRGISSENQFPKTSKTDKNRHGIGMKNIMDAVNKYDGVMRWRAEDRIFYTEVLLYGVDNKR